MKLHRIYTAFLLFCGIVLANPLQQKIEAFMSKNNYQKNIQFVKKVFANERNFYNGDTINVEKVLATLNSNGLLSLKLPKPTNISVTFRLNAAQLTDKEPSPTFLAYSASNILSSMGYSYFYITEAAKESEKIAITYTLNAESNINPLVMINNLKKRGYAIVNVHRYSATRWIYDVSLKESSILAAKPLEKGTSTITQINGRYWLATKQAGTLQITPKDNTESWYPKIFIFDNALNPIDIIMLADSKTSYQVTLPKHARHLLITDNYNASILRNGITLDFMPK